MQKIQRNTLLNPLIPLHLLILYTTFILYITNTPTPITLTRIPFQSPLPQALYSECPIKKRNAANVKLKTRGERRSASTYGISKGNGRECAYQPTA